MKRLNVVLVACSCVFVCKNVNFELALRLSIIVGKEITIALFQIQSNLGFQTQIHSLACMLGDPRSINITFITLLIKYFLNVTIVHNVK